VTVAAFPEQFAAVVAELAFPLRAAVMILAEKSPFESLLTNVEAVLESVAADNAV
jgi:hypothetical protein